MLSTFDVNPRWRDSLADEAEEAAESSSSSSQGRGRGRGVTGSSTGTTGTTSTSRVSGGSGATQESSTDSASSRRTMERRGSWAIDVPQLEGDDAEVLAPADDVPPVDDDGTSGGPPSPKQLRHEAEQNSSAPQRRDIGNSTAPSNRELYLNARKNLFGSGNVSSSANGSVASDLSRRGASDHSSAASLDADEAAELGGGVDCDWDLSTTGIASTTVPAWMKERVRRQQQQLRQQQSQGNESINQGSSKSMHSSHSFRSTRSDPNARNPASRSAQTDYVTSLNDGVEKGGKDDPEDASIRKSYQRRNSSEDLRRERRSRSTWGRGSKRRSISSAGDVPDDDQGNSFADRLDRLYDADVSSHHRARSYHEGLDDEGDDALDDFNDRLDSHSTNISSSQRSSRSLCSPSSRRSHRSKPEHSISDHQRRASLGEPGNQFARPKRQSSGKDLQDIAFSLSPEKDGAGERSDPSGEGRHNFTSTSTMCTTSSSSHDEEQHHSSLGLGPIKITVSRGIGGGRSPSPSHAKPNKMSYGLESDHDPFDFNPFGNRDIETHIIHQRKRSRWANIVFVTTIAALLVAAIAVSLLFLGDSSSNSDVVGMTDTLASVSLPSYIESNIADWADTSPLQDSKRRDAWIVQRRKDNDETDTGAVADFDPIDETSLELRLAVPQAGDVPLFWRIPFSGSTETEEVFGQCLGLVQASDLGIAKDHRSDSSLATVTVDGSVFLNVDTTTHEGIVRAKELQLVQSGLPDVVETPLLHDAAKHLFDPSHRGQMIAVLRHPVDRTMATYHQLTTGRFHGPNGEILEQLSTKTLEEYADSEFCDDNWLTRSLVNKPSGPLKKKDLTQAMAILQRKLFIGLFSDLANSIQHFASHLGWGDQSSSLSMCASELVDKAYAREQEGFPELDVDSPAYDKILKKNYYDIQLYEFATELREQQKALM